MLTLGPHGFIVDLRTNGCVYPGVSLGDMGVKTTGINTIYQGYHNSPYHVISGLSGLFANESVLGGYWYTNSVLITLITLITLVTLMTLLQVTIWIMHGSSLITLGNPNTTPLLEPSNSNKHLMTYICMFIYACPG